LIEVNGPGGYYTEILRVYVVGKQPSQALQEAYGVAIEAHEMTVKGLMPGADPKELWANYRNFVTRKGYFGPSRSFAHGQGLSLVDRPNLRPDEPWKIKAGMNIAVHPYAVNKEAFSIYGDNYITTDSGPERLHKYSREITVV
jgi:Xaa-Pro aminopeptidase